MARKPRKVHREQILPKNGTRTRNLNNVGINQTTGEWEESYSVWFESNILLASSIWSDAAFENVVSKAAYEEGIDEELEELKSDIKELIHKRVNKIIEHFLTKHQQYILKRVVFDCCTAKEVAKELGINATGISHSIYGIWYIKRQKCHGG